MLSPFGVKEKERLLRVDTSRRRNRCLPTGVPSPTVFPSLPFLYSLRKPYDRLMSRDSYGIESPDSAGIAKTHRSSQSTRKLGKVASGGKFSGSRPGSPSASLPSALPFPGWLRSGCIGLPGADAPTPSGRRLCVCVSVTGRKAFPGPPEDLLSGLVGLLLNH